MALLAPGRPGYALESSGASQIVIGTGSPLGIYFLAGNALCRVLESQKKEINSSNSQATDKSIQCSAPATPGSLANLQSLRSRRLNFGLVQSDWQHNAYHGLGQFEGRSLSTLRSVLSLHSEALQILVGRDTSIASFAGLRGRKVGVGPPGSGDRATFEVLLESADKKVDWFGDYVTLSTDQRTSSLCAGDVEATVFLTGAPSKQVGDLLDKCDARLLSLDISPVRRLLEAFPFYGPATIRADSYEGIRGDVESFGVFATLVTTHDTDEQLVYDLVRVVFSNVDSLRQAHPAFAQLSEPDMARAGLSAPLHAGAARFYREQGWLVD